MAPEKIILRFTAETVKKPIIYTLAKEYDLVANIVKASINPDQEGTMVLELTGERYDEGVRFLEQQGIKVQPLAQEVRRNEDKCTHCGNCTAHCPTKALFIERPSMNVQFNQDECILCLMCVKICPVHAMEVRV
ncbi:MAG TPA: 4Fe-4S binding protein [Peptococcaceae bacterium]|jgi:ferredoxin|nr:4Fe-4S binding protein [Clostridia bacterium]HOB82599.1 4Fe-4S binding protein [Peptococcaceae bacterium]HPZ70683.1 4Fe-4S binding protein [Peptococcaceae bacterium]HQD54601.1 4Fe-4S binding protein [Peptococcaceae bacterium]